MRLRAWIRHLALQICAGPGDPRVTEVYGRRGDESDLQLALPPLDAALAHQHLSALVERYLAGQTRPAPFLPDAGWAWQSVIADKGPGVAQKVARKAAEDTWMYDTESAARWARVYGEDPWSRRDVVGAFEEISERVFAGLYNLEGA
jgi:exonuclease V gamma subunit